MNTQTLVRRTDPQTSHQAAQQAALFAPAHAARIHEALLNGPNGGMNAEQIGHATGLTVVQVDRRTIELQRRGLIRVRQVNGSDVVLNGMRVWEAMK